MRRLVIHIGTEKTGTTSLQHFFYLNEPALLRAGVALLHSADEPNNRKVATYAFMRRMHEAYDLDVVRQGGPQWRENLRAAVRAEIEALPARVHTVLVTSEHLHSRLNTQEEVAQVAELFQGLFETVEVVVYLRRQDRLAISLYSTALRGGWTQESPFPPDTDHRNRYYNYQELLARWAQVFGEPSLRVRRFEPRHMVDGSLYADFLTVIGLADLKDQLKLPPNQNEALPATVAAAVLSFNQAMEQLALERETPRTALWRRQLIQDLGALYPGPGPAFARAPAWEFYQRFAPSNAEVSQRWFQGVPLFDEDFSAYPETPAPVVLPQQVLNVVFTGLFNLPGNPAAKPKVTPGSLAERLEALPTGIKPRALLRRIGRTIRPELPNLGQRLENISHAIPEDWHLPVAKPAPAKPKPAQPAGVAKPAAGAMVQPATTPDPKAKA